jgi:hypothetical protein
MAKKYEFAASLYRDDDYRGSGEFEMPFTWSEYQDALEKARATDMHTPVTIELTYTKRDCLRPHTMDINDGKFTDTRDLLNLNLLAQRLDGMDEGMQDCFEAQVALEQKSLNPDESIPLARLINLTYQTKDCIYGGGSRTYAELGQFLFENDMLPEDVLDKTIALTGSFDAEIPKEWLTLVGRQHFETHGGVFTKAGYFECPTEIPEVYKRGEMVYFNRSGAPVVLEVTAGAFNKSDYAGGKVAATDCPVHPVKQESILKKIGVDSIDECAWRCTDCLIPDAKKWITEAKDFGDVEKFADFLYNLERRETPEKYKALLQSAKCSDLDAALRLGADLEAYEFFPMQSTPAHYGRDALYEIYGDETANALYPYMDCFKYGKNLMETEHAEITDYGIIRRKDFELIQVPEPDEGETEEFGMGGIQ